MSSINALREILTGLEACRDAHAAARAAVDRLPVPPVTVEVQEDRTIYRCGDGESVLYGRGIATDKADDMEHAARAHGAWMMRRFEEQGVNYYAGAGVQDEIDRVRTMILRAEKGNGR